MSEPTYFQTVTLVLDDGRKVHFTGRHQIPTDPPPRVVEVIVSKAERLPDGLNWDTLPTSDPGMDHHKQAEEA